MFKKYFSLNNLSTLLLYFSILAFTVAFNFSDNRSGGWYQQFLPDLNGRIVSDIAFTDSLNGFATCQISFNYNYILKTTNGGDNWFLSDSLLSQLTKLQFLNLNTGYACGAYLYKTTDAGNNWQNVNTSGIVAQNMSVLNEDTIWITDSDGLVGGVYKTNNGGMSWTRQLNLGTLNPENIYMYNKDIGFISKVNTGAPYTRKTTDGGQSWFVVVNNEGFTDINFTDSLTGWRAAGPGRFVKKTSDGGIKWTMQSPPSGGNIYVTPIFKFSNVNKDTIWGAGGVIQFGVNNYRGMIYNTTNGGNNWGYQLPDTSIHIEQYNQIDFTNRLNGWVLGYGLTTEVHSITGGDTTYYTNIKQLSSIFPGSFNLEQNYPNPFNPKTKIKFEISIKGNVIINILDITGKQKETILKSFLTPGEYETEFNGSNYMSGIYFYNLIVDGKVIDTKKMILLK